MSIIDTDQLDWEKSNNLPPTNDPFKQDARLSIKQISDHLRNVRRKREQERKSNSKPLNTFNMKIKQSLVMLMTQTFGVAHLAAQSTADGIAELERKAVSKTGYLTKDGSIKKLSSNELKHWSDFRRELTTEAQMKAKEKFEALRARKLKFNFNTSK